MDRDATHVTDPRQPVVRRAAVVASVHHVTVADVHVADDEPVLYLHMGISWLRVYVRGYSMWYMEYSVFNTHNVDVNNLLHKFTCVM